MFQVILTNKIKYKVAQSTNKQVCIMQCCTLLSCFSHYQPPWKSHFLFFSRLMQTSCCLFFWLTTSLPLFALTLSLQTWYIIMHLSMLSAKVGGGGGVAGLPSGNLTFLGKPESNSLLRISAPRKRFSLEVKQLGAPCMFKVPT